MQENQAKRWKKIIESECPEKEKFPQEWKNKTALQSKRSISIRIFSVPFTGRSIT